MKVFEYFYIMKPVVSTPILELKRPIFSDLIAIESEVKKMSEKINNILDNPWPIKNQRKQKKSRKKPRLTGRPGIHSPFLSFA